MKNTSKPIAPPQLRLPLGTVLKDKNDKTWVFVGYAESTVSTSLVFSRVVGKVGPYMTWTYYAVEKRALVGMFPSLVEYFAR